MTFGNHTAGPIDAPSFIRADGRERAIESAWPGFRAAVTGYDCIFLHEPTSSPPTTSTGRGFYYYWPRKMVAGVECYVTEDVERGVVHLAPVASVEGNAIFDAWWASVGDAR